MEHDQRRHQRNGAALSTIFPRLVHACPEAETSAQELRGRRVLSHASRTLLVIVTARICKGCGGEVS